MSAEPVQAGLARAQRAIESTYDELCMTLETVRALTENGAPEEALRLVGLQRDALDRLVHRVATDIAVVPVLRKPRRIRAAAAAALAVAAAAAGLFVARTDAASPSLDQQLARAERIVDPSQRLEAISKLYGASLTRPKDVSDSFRTRVIAAATKIADDSRRDDDKTDDRLLSRANTLASSAQNGDPAPPSPPSQGESPLDGVRERIRRPRG